MKKSIINLRKRMVCGLVVAAFLPLIGSVHAQSLLAGWYSYNPTTTTFPWSAGTLNSSLASAQLSYYQMTPVNDSRGVWAAANQSATLDVSTAPYLQWTININSGKVVTNATFFINLAKLDSTTSFELRDSLDNYATSLGDLSTVSSSYQNYMFSLGSTTLSGTVSFRLYVYDVSSLYANNLTYNNAYNAMSSSSYTTHGGTFNSLMNNYSGGLLGGTTVAPVPEPSGCLLTGLGLSGLLALRRRRA